MPATPIIVVPPPTISHVILTPDQVTALLNLLGSATPPIIELPTGKQLTDVIRFNVTVQQAITAPGTTPAAPGGTLDITIK